VYANIPMRVCTSIANLAADVNCSLATMPDRKPRPDRITPHRDKLCKACGRAFSWRADLARDWDVLKHCSDTCRGTTPGAHDAALEAAILTLLAERGPGKTICPSEAAKLVGNSGRKHTLQQWQPLMGLARAAARRLATAGRIDFTQHGRPVDPATAKGPIRLRLR
jgi:hypothetical protein